jgi:glycosyltransferase involved in cell wall biosynthesis
VLRVQIVFDAFAVRPGSSAVILENLLVGWQQVAPEDSLTVLVDGEPQFRVANGVRIERVQPPRGGKAGSLWLRTVGVRKAARRLGADGVISAVTASALLGTRAPRGVVLTDLRHELRPDQFPLSRRIARRLAYAWSFGIADGGIYCISERTLGDLASGHRFTAKRGVAARCGGDHVDAWPVVKRVEPPYAVAFGQFANKNVDAVLAAWQEFCRTDSTWTLRLVGMGRVDREQAAGTVEALGLTGRVEPMPWLDDEEFAVFFAGASMVLFPSDFEGFGLPVVEAMRLGIPVVVSGDAALREVTGGYAEIAEDLAPAALAQSIARAARRTPSELEQARRHAEQFTWGGMATAMRDALLGAGA